MLYLRRQPHLLSCLIVLGFGYSTSLQLGKIAPFAARIQAEAGQSLTYTGFLTSVLAAFVACLAIPASRAVLGFGIGRSLKAAALVMAVGAVLFGVAATPATLLAARAFEGMGYVVAVVAAPAYLTAFGPPQWRGSLLALWGSIVPVGFALSNILAAQLPAGVSLSDAYLSYAVPIGALAGLVLLVRSGEQSAPIVTPANNGPADIVWPLVAAFGLYVYLSIGFFTFLPAYLAQNPTGAGSGATIALCVPVGSFSAAVLLFFLGSRVALPAMAAGLAAVTLAALFLFPVTGEHGPAMILYALACGVTAASILAAVPLLARSAGSATRTIGGIAQAGGAMVLVGAPVAGAIIESGGWQMLGRSFAVAALALLVLTRHIWRQAAHM